jgi:hypothetical protein
VFAFAIPVFYFALKCSMLFIYGSRKKMIGASEAFLYKCPYCEETNTTSIAFFSNYYHIFFIPIFPFGKEAYASCSHCGAARSDNKFGPELVKQAKEVEGKFKPPFYLYAWLILFVAFILLIVIVAPK